MTVRNKLTYVQRRHLKISQKYRDQQRRDFKKLLDKKGPLEIPDVFEFFEGLSRENKQYAGMLFVGKCAIDGMTSAQILERLNPKKEDD